MADPQRGEIEALAGEHVRLETLLRQFEEQLSHTPGGVERAQFTRLLDEVALHCRRHMEFEEQGGYFTGVLERMPGLSDAVAQLRAQHVTLLAELTDCIAAARQVSDITPLPEPLLERFRSWIEQLRTHELQENDLTQAAYYDDVGSAD